MLRNNLIMFWWALKYYVNSIAVSYRKAGWLDFAQVYCLCCVMGLLIGIYFKDIIFVQRVIFATVVGLGLVHFAVRRDQNKAAKEIITTYTGLGIKMTYRQARALSAYRKGEKPCS